MITYGTRVTTVVYIWFHAIAITLTLLTERDYFIALIGIWIYCATVSGINRYYRPGAAGPVPLYNSHAQSYYC